MDTIKKKKHTHKTNTIATFRFKLFHDRWQTFMNIFRQMKYSGPHEMKSGRLAGLRKNSAVPSRATSCRLLGGLKTEVAR